MSQAQVMKQLEKETDWISTKELAKKLRMEPPTLCNNLLAMRKYGEVETVSFKRPDHITENKHRLVRK